MNRLTDCAQGYCEMYCKKYGHCFGDPGDCIFKDEVKMYEALKSIEGVVPFDRLIELAHADKDARIVVLPCKVGDTVYEIRYMTDKEAIAAGIASYYTNRRYAHRKPVSHPLIVAEREMKKTLYSKIGKTIFLSREEADEAYNAIMNHDSHGE